MTTDTHSEPTRWNLSAEALLGAGLILLAVLLCVHTLTFRGLYADGAYFLIEEVRTGAVSGEDWARVHALWVMQLPVLLGLRAGISGMKHLAWLHSLGLFLFPALCYGLALYAVRRDGALLCGFLVTISGIMATTGLFAIGEFHIGLACATLAVALLLGPAPLSRFSLGLLPLVALVAVRSYENFLFLGPALILLVLVRWRAAEVPARAEKFVLCVSAACFALACTLSAWSVLRPMHPENLDQAIRLSLLLGNSLLLAWLAFCAAAYVGMLASRAPLRLRLPVGSVGTARLAPAFLRHAARFWALLALAIGGLWFVSHPSLQYSARIPVSLLLLGFILVGTVYRFASAERDGSDDGAGPHSMAALRQGAILALALMALSDIGTTLGWFAYLDAFRRVVNEGHGQIAWEDSGLSPRYAWTWTNPSLSLVVRKTPDAAIVRNPNRPMWQPFDPSRSLPDLGGRLWQ